MKRTTMMGLLALSTWAFLGCQEEITTVLEGDFIPVDAVTVEVTLPFHEFAGELVAWGGYGRPYQLATGIVARAFEGSLDSRVLNSWYPYPVAASVRDSTGSIRTDSLLTFVGGRIVARFDTLTSVLEGPVTLAIGALQRDWDSRSATWTLAVDSVGDRQLWTEEGAGPVTPLGTAVWDPAAGDSVVFEIDSAGVALWADTAEAGMGVRLDAVTEGVRLDLRGLTYLLSTRPSIHTDTIVELAVASSVRTFVYQPVPDVPGAEIRVGGVPAWRTVFTMGMPKTLDGPAELCQVVQCPLTLTPGSLISASLVLTTQAPPPAFQPTDSLYLDVRPVLEPSRLPKSPLGSSLAGIQGVILEPGDFGGEAGAEIEIPLGSYIETLIARNSGADVEVPATLALLSLFEPLSLYFAAFEGPDSPAGPKLRLILTLAEDVRIR
ncbi:MAG: hypothetical protein ABIF09_07445 [Gemmatimonadota bacterium]